MRRLSPMVPTLLTALVLVALPAQASFHFMQVEQVISDVCGDTSQQAIQLRMRASGQNIVSEARMRVFDDTGGDPIFLVDMSTNVSSSAAGSRVLITSSNFAATQGITPDFTLANLIPSVWFDAGRITFEEDTGTVYWSLAWGGPLYTGPHSGSTTNDADGNFGPAFPGPLPFGGRGLRFTGGSAAASTNNAADYAVTANPTVTANNGSTVTITCFLFADGFEGGNTSAWSGAVP